MNYTRIYESFIADRRGREADLIASGEYFERHHITPRSLGSGDEPENLIALTADDHYFAHALLARVYGGHMWLPLVRMSRKASQTRQEFGMSARLRTVYRLAKEKHAQYLSASKKGRKDLVENNFAKTWKRSEKVFNWENMRTGETFTGTWFDAHDWSGVPVPKLRGVACGNYPSYHGVKLLERKIATREETLAAAKTPEAVAKRAEKQRGQLRPSTRGVKNHKARAVRCVELNKMFDTVTEAVSQGYATQHANICRAVRTNKTAGGYHWEYVS